MHISLILQKLEGHKGQNLVATWHRQLKTRKGYASIVEKITTAKIRSGIVYDNQLIVKMKREIGERPEQNAGLPWGHWIKAPYHIRHEGVDYVRLYPASDSVKFSAHPIHPTVKYLLNGEETTKEIAQSICRDSEFKREIADCFTVRAENVDEIEER